MRLNIHEVVAIEIDAGKDFGDFHDRKITIHDKNGMKYEIVLFADSADALKFKATVEV